MADWWRSAVLGLLVACSGGTTVDEDPDPGVEQTDKVELDKILGTWRVELGKARERRMAVIAAALSAEPLRVKGLGKLDKDEKDLYETWSRKTGRDVRLMEKKLRLTRARYIVGDEQITVQVDNDGIRESFGPVAYETLESSDSRTVLRFDPGMGNGYETHTVLWEGTNKATNRITANGQALIELPFVREAGPVTPPGG